MTRYVALLRAVNVGGTGKLPMTELKSMCSEAGFARVETYIASGNVVFTSNAGPSRVKAKLEARLLAHFGKPMGVAVRTASEMLAVLRANLFLRRSRSTLTHSSSTSPLRAMARSHGLGKVGRRGHSGIGRSSFTGNGMGRSKLKIPAPIMGTARNMNTVAKLAEIASKP